MVGQPLQEDLLEELTRLVGRPSPVVRDAFSRLLGVLLREVDGEVARNLAAFPMTAWQSIAPGCPALRNLWTATLSAGLTVEEVFTAFAVIDDHVRRRYGAEAWTTLAEWGPRFELKYVPEQAKVGVGARPEAWPRYADL
jgi:hypothetical protein